MFEALKCKTLFRLVLLAVALVLAALVFVFQPERVSDLLFKAAFLTGIGVAAFYMDILFMPYARPHLFLPEKPPLAVGEAKPGKCYENPVCEVLCKDGTDCIGGEAGQFIIGSINNDSLFIWACFRRTFFVIGCMIAAALVF
ncbi:MAG TPA: putative holin [Usitatibacteraceae bacterium]